MKNIFKSMMLVAVAAMTFTACEKDNADNNNATDTRVVKFTATIGEDDTRSGFSGTTTDGGKTLYTSTWDGDEWLIVSPEKGGNYMTAENPIIKKNGSFEVAFDTTPEYVTVYSPLLSWSGGRGTYSPDVDFFTTQTPREDSVDPNAHVLYSEKTTVNGEDNVTIKMKHALAYGKMTLDVKDFNITRVEIMLAGDTSVNTYTLYATNVKDNVFWFGAMPVNVTNFTVKAYGDGDAYLTKEVTIGEQQTLNFQAGHVSTFTVKNLSRIEVELPTNIEFTYAEWTNSDKNDKYIAFTNTTFNVGLRFEFYYSNAPNYIAPGDYEINIDCGAYDIYPGLVTSDGIRYYSFYTTDLRNLDDLKNKGTDPTISNPNAISLVTKGTVKVSIVEGEYYFEFIDLTDDEGSYTLNGTFKGTIKGMNTPQQ